MSSEPKLPLVGEPDAVGTDEQFRRARRKLFVDALVGVPVILTLTSKPLWAVVAENATNTTGAAYMTEAPAPARFDTPCSSSNPDDCSP